MSLDPEWASTVFGVYSFSSLFLSGLAACILLVIWLRRSLSLETVFSDDLLHDLGTLLFAFSSFWMYAWFCQYMLIWYVNIPEETVYLRQRQQGGWLGVLLLDLALNWAVPFAVLLFRSAKRNPRILSNHRLDRFGGPLGRPVCHDFSVDADGRSRIWTDRGGTDLGVGRPLSRRRLSSARQSVSGPASPASCC